MALSALQMAQMSRLLDEALELDEAGRRRWLEHLEPQYAPLALDLRQALLPQAGTVAATPKLEPLAQGQAQEALERMDLEPGQRVGPYELVRLLGAGGMAEVWLAQRADGAFKREVALKLPMLSGLRRDLAQRFAHERDILAGLEHVNIARLYDAGVSAEGLPYLAMEYVPGQPLTAWCDAHRLGIRERIKLFLQVLDAVQYAHARQVIHRDIKPSNVLVTDAGQVRLLDFGVAKLLADEDSDRTQLTQIYGRALTPDYASPEYLLGDPVDALSDIYSLGVMLYELLAGSRPYRLKSGASLVQLERAITEAQIGRPSTQLSDKAGAARALTQGTLARRLRGDLDAIVLKALARDSTQRYGSAAAMADDLQRHLAGEPVEAQPDRLGYRAGKFVLRHRSGVAMSTAALLALALGAVLEQNRAPSAPTQASAPAINDKSIAVLPFVDMSEKKDQEYFSDGLAEELLDLLSRVPGLQVVARTSAFSFKGKPDDIRTIARKLQVANVLEGSVRRSGNRLRITTQLVRADSGFGLWSQTYDRRIADIFTIQDEIAGSIVQALRMSLMEGAMPAPASVEVTSMDDIDEVLEKLRFPLFIKPAKAGDSLGVDEHSRVHNESELTTKIGGLLREYGDILVEEYIAGREFTVLVAANTDGKTCMVYKPIEYVFPEGREFKTYALKTSELHPDCNIPCHDFKLEKRLKTAAEHVFTAFGGVGYGRMDFRLNDRNEIYFLEVNFTCSAFYEDGMEGSADYILKYDPAGKKGFLDHIIKEGIVRHRAKQRKYTLKGSEVSGYGIFANQELRKGEIIFMGEALSQRIISKRYVDKHWNERQKRDFSQYAYPISKEIYILWDENPVNWAPQNHSCDANTAYEGLNVVAVRDIAKGEELTLDYALFLDESMEPFVCQCGSENCREMVFGVKENAIGGPVAKLSNKEKVVVPVPHRPTTRSSSRNSKPGRNR